MFCSRPLVAFAFGKADSRADRWNECHTMFSTNQLWLLNRLQLIAIDCSWMGWWRKIVAPIAQICCGLNHSWPREIMLDSIGIVQWPVYFLTMPCHVMLYSIEIGNEICRSGMWSRCNDSLCAIFTLKFNHIATKWRQILDMIALLCFKQSSCVSGSHPRITTQLCLAKTCQYVSIQVLAIIWIVDWNACWLNVVHVDCRACGLEQQSCVMEACDVVWSVDCNLRD